MACYEDKLGDRNDCARLRGITVSNRHHRRADLAKIKRNTPGALLTYLVEPDEPALDGMPLLKAAPGHWTGRSRRWSSLPHLQFILVTSRDIGDVAQHA